jgi:prolyl oligopeptidase
LRFHTSLLGASWTSEYGDPDVEEEYEWIKEYSPYQHVEAREYPDTFFVTAAGDTRVDPFHARKMAARMQEKAEDTLVCLRVDTATGHGTGKPVSQDVAERAEHLCFLYDRLGLDAER